MATDTNTFEATQPLRGIGWRRFAVFLVAALVVLIALAAFVAFTLAGQNAGRVNQGVTVGGIDVAGLDAATVEQKLRTELPDVRRGSLQLHIGTIDHEIPYSEIGRDYEMAAMVDQAMNVGRGSNPLELLVQQLMGTFATVEVAPVVTWDQELLASRVAAIAHAAQVSPTNATITYEGGQYVVTPGSDGSSVNVDDVVSQAIAAVTAATVGDVSVTLEPTIVPADISTPAAQAAVDRAEGVVATPLTVTYGTASSAIASDTLRQWVSLEETSPGVWTLVIDRAAAEQHVVALKAQTDQPAVEAAVLFEGGQPSAAPSQTGLEMDAAAGTDAIVAALATRGDGGSAPQASLPVLVTQPEFTTEDALALVSRFGLLGSWTTHYIPSTHNNNGINIRRPTDLIDGTVVQPGAVFDFVDVAGPITRANGYGDGAAIIGGNTRDEGVLGGGLCSASTTLFNAALRAGFDMGARRNHAYYITRYPVGLDATIWISGSYVQTMSFTNDSAYPIVIRGLNYKRKVTYEIWGVSDGRTVHIADPIVANEREAQNYYEFTDDLPPRSTEREEYAADGFNSSVDRVVRDANGTTIHQDTFRSGYRRVDGIVLVGRLPGDPPAGTRIPYSEGLPPAPNPTGTPKPSDDPNAAPTAKFDFQFKANGKVNFFDTSTGSPDTWTWDFGDGGSSTERNPSHTFAPGKHTITLTVTNANGADSTTEKITISGGPGPTDPPTPPPTDSPPPTSSP